MNRGFLIAAAVALITKNYWLDLVGLCLSAVVYVPQLVVYMKQEES